MGMCLVRRAKMARFSGHETERMRGGLRLAMTIWAAGLALGAAPLAAQNAPDSASSTPATDAIGPKELQNFSLSGTVTKPADRPGQAAAASSNRRAAASQAEATSAPEPRHSETPRQSPPVTRSASSTPVQSAVPAPQRTAALAAASLDSPAASPPPTAAAVPASAGFAPATETTDGTLAPERSLPMWPWLLAALALGAAGAFLFWRNRSRVAFAGGPQVDLFTAPEPAPSPRPVPPPKAPEPAPPRATPPAPQGIVSTRLRPWVEVAMHPLRCIVDEAQVAFEFELELFNSGNAPARAVLVEASVFNAGPTQEQDIGAFFARPVGEGERIDSIPPLQRMSIRTQVVAPRDNLQALDIGGRLVFVPLIAFNTLYRWSGGEGQTSVSYLLGRDTKGEKMAPFRLDLGPRVFRSVGARPLPSGIRN
jgi:hypothetical protein